MTRAQLEPRAKALVLAYATSLGHQQPPPWMYSIVQLMVTEALAHGWDETERTWRQALELEVVA